jgi:hypothetical protein
MDDQEESLVQLEDEALLSKLKLAEESEYLSASEKEQHKLLEVLQAPPLKKPSADTKYCE